MYPVFYQITQDTQRGIFTCIEHYPTRKDAIERAKNLSRLDNGTREVTLNEWHYNSPEGYPTFSTRYSNGIKEY